MDAFGIKSWLDSHGIEPSVATINGHQVLTLAVKDGFDCGKLANHVAGHDSRVVLAAVVLVIKPEFRLVPNPDDAWLSPQNVAALWLDDLLGSLDNETIEQILEHWDPPGLETALAEPGIVEMSTWRVPVK